MNTYPTMASTESTVSQAHELTHDWCCDRDRSLCGLDLTGEPDCPEDLSCGCEQCVVCDDLLDSDGSVTCRRAS